MDSDEDGNVDHLSPQTLLETSEPEVQYTVRPQEGMITYRVVQVDDPNVEAAVPHIVTTGATGYSNASPVPQVLTSNINGQLYVIGNAAEVFGTQTGTRAIAPRSSITDSIIESNSSIVSSIKKRDERRRATHNEVERRRRDKINNWITKLASIIPESPNDIKGSGHYDGQSKGGILAKACDYITDLKHIHEKYEDLLREHKEALERLEYEHQKNIELEKDNRLLKALLKKHSILIVPDENKSS
ncbi:unnamed protein product [Acanthoscelides obtectus]|nr:unnamed protein product [Acanthoscelides obtectus]CAK1623137.1 Upstream stimulatory factor 2 [Acanthoscelides obtectus]